MADGGDWAKLPRRDQKGSFTESSLARGARGPWRTAWRETPERERDRHLSRIGAAHLERISRISHQHLATWNRWARASKRLQQTATSAAARASSCAPIYTSPRRTLALSFRPCLSLPVVAACLLIARNVPRRPRRHPRRHVLRPPYPPPG
ncbi:hypothetical protein K474DRAFT_727194 [Panus rudis PR-1116 ss-1]|nr:hypothetical protein K474DRAFT_727194 [Panus rudis PR-1116 ss-1]